MASRETQTPQFDPEHAGPRIDFQIDGERYETRARTLTPRELLVEFAGVDAVTHYLIEIKGRDQESFEQTPDVPIQMHEHMKFITAKSGPTPVS